MEKTHQKKFLDNINLKKIGDQKVNIISIFYELAIISISILTFLSFGFNENNLFFDWVYKNLWVFTLIFTLDLLFKFILIKFVFRKKILLNQERINVKENSKILIRTFIILDVLTIFSFIPQIKWFILFKLFNIIKIFWYFPRIRKVMNIIGSGIKKVIFPVTIVMIILTLIMFIGAAFNFYYEFDANPSINNYWDSLWFTFVSLTTIGFGDIVPVTTGGKIISVLFSIIGILTVSLITGIIIYGITTEGNRLIKKEEQKTIKKIIKSSEEDVFRKIIREEIEKANITSTKKDTTSTKKKTDKKKS